MPSNPISDCDDWISDSSDYIGGVEVDAGVGVGGNSLRFLTRERYIGLLSGIVTLP